MKTNKAHEAQAVAGALSSGARSLIVNFALMAAEEWRKLVADVSRVFASERRHRQAIEQELFRGRYTLSSKNDDDLPIP